LEYYGGFPSLVQNDKDKFPSSIAKDGTVGWSAIDSQKVASSNYTANATLSVSFPEVDWSFLQLVYGWASTQYQAWARGEIVLTGDVSQNILVWSDHILEFAVDGQRHFGGDFFAFRKAPLVLKLKPGRHVIDLRLVRDVRAMGGIGVPSIDVELQFRIAREDLEVREGSILMPDVIEGKFGSPYGSVALTNTGATSIQIFGLYATDVSALDNLKNYWLIHKECNECAAPSARRGGWLGAGSDASPPLSSRRSRCEQKIIAVHRSLWRKTS
jgi:hypothetical protein